MVEAGLDESGVEMVKSAVVAVAVEAGGELRLVRAVCTVVYSFEREGARFYDAASKAPGVFEFEIRRRVVVL